MVNKVNFLGF